MYLLHHLFAYIPKINCIITSFNPLATEGVGGGEGSLEPQAVCFCYFFIFAKVLQGVASM